MIYRLYLDSKAEKNLNKLLDLDIVKVQTAFVVIASNPFVGKKLKGEQKNEWSYRVWPFRIIYRIYKNELIVLVINYGHRQGNEKGY